MEQCCPLGLTAVFLGSLDWVSLVHVPPPSHPLPGWIDVTWDAGGSNSYRMGAEGKFDLKLAPGYDPESAPSPKTVSCAIAGPPTPWSSLAKNNCPDRGGPSSVSSGRKGSSSSACSDIGFGSARRLEGLSEQGTLEGGGPMGTEGQEPLVVLSTVEGGSASSESAEPKSESTAISVGPVSVSSPDVSSVSDSSGKAAVSQRPLGPGTGARLSVSSLLAAGAPMSSSASVPNLSSREASLMESFVRRAPNMARTNATNNMNLSRSSSDNNTNTIGRNVAAASGE